MLVCSEEVRTKSLAAVVDTISQHFSTCRTELILWHDRSLFDQLSGTTSSPNSCFKSCGVVLSVHFDEIAAALRTPLLHTPLADRAHSSFASRWRNSWTFYDECRESGRLITRDSDLEEAVVSRALLQSC